MSVVVSATVKFSGGNVASANFLHKAHSLLAQSQAYSQRGDLDLAFISAYQAGLRVAGALIADSPVAKRKRNKPRSAWDQLRMVGDAESSWANRLEAYSNTRNRVETGRFVELSEAQFFALHADVVEFLAYAEGDVVDVATAA